MLAISGKLEVKPPGDSPVAHIDPNEMRRVSANRFEKDQTHRSVYLPIVRSMMPEFLDVFDVAEPTMVTGSRDTTTVPTQALFLMNNPFVTQQAQAFAQRLMKDSAMGDTSRVDMA